MADCNLGVNDQLMSWEGSNGGCQRKLKSNSLVQNSATELIAREFDDIMEDDGLDGSGSTV